MLSETPRGAAGGRGVIDGAFRVLRALPVSGAGRGQVARLAALCGVPRPTVHRLLGQLQGAGAVERGPRGWVLSPGLVGLAHQVDPVHGLRSAAVGVVQALREQTGAATSLVVPAGDSFVALEMVPGRYDLPIDARPGAVMPDTTAAALALGGAGAPPSSRRRNFGAATDNQDVLPGLTCYAVAVPLPGGHRASLQIATPAWSPAERLAGAVHRAGAALARAVASTTPPAGPTGGASVR